MSEKLLAHVEELMALAEKIGAEFAIEDLFQKKYVLEHNLRKNKNKKIASEIYEIGDKLDEYAINQGIDVKIPFFMG